METKYIVQEIESIDYKRDTIIRDLKKEKDKEIEQLQKKKNYHFDYKSSFFKCFKIGIVVIIIIKMIALANHYDEPIVLSLIIINTIISTIYMCSKKGELDTYNKTIDEKIDNINTKLEVQKKQICQDAEKEKIIREKEIRNSIKAKILHYIQDISCEYVCDDILQNFYEQVNKAERGYHVAKVDEIFKFKVEEKCVEYLDAYNRSGYSIRKYDFTKHRISYLRSMEERIAFTEACLRICKLKAMKSPIVYDPTVSSAVIKIKKKDNIGYLRYIAINNNYYKK